MFSFVVIFVLIITLHFSGIATFELEYGQWVEEQDRDLSDLRDALQSSETRESELQIFVDGGLGHYFELFRMKAIAAKTDVFYLMSGMWKTSAERFFFWIGGFRPSELLKVIHILFLRFKILWCHMVSFTHGM